MIEHFGNVHNALSLAADEDVSANRLFGMREGKIERREPVGEFQREGGRVHFRENYETAGEYQPAKAYPVRCGDVDLDVLDFDYANRWVNGSGDCSFVERGEYAHGMRIKTPHHR